MAVPPVRVPQGSRVTDHAPDWASLGPPYRPTTVPPTDQALWVRVIRHARCADGRHDPEQWFPISAEIGKARQEAATAIAVCTTCPVRAQCLALSLRHWEIGQHGVWGGLVAAERAALRRLVHANLATPDSRSHGRSGTHVMAGAAGAASSPANARSAAAGPGGRARGGLLLDR